MVVKEIKYTDYNGVPCVDKTYFNMTKDEIIRFQVKEDGKFIDRLKQLVEGQHIEELYKFFRDFVLDAYGEKSEDGKRFVKTPAMREEFESSIAFSELMGELFTSKTAVAEFTRATLPIDFQAIEIPEDLTESDAAALNPAG